MILACSLAVAAIALNYTSIRDLLQTQYQDQTPPSDDPIAELVDLGS